MVNSFSVNASSMVRPGTFVSQRSVSNTPVPIANHAVAYLFGTVEDDLTDLSYKGLLPYKPTQITSTNDYIEKVGGIPKANAGSRITYDAINAYFSNVGSNGILYLTRVTPTPEIILEVPTTVTQGYDLIILSINGVKYGDVSNDVLGKVIVSSGIDAPDVAYDIYGYLSQDTNFNLLFNVEEITPNDATNRQVRLTAKDANVLLSVDEFKVYKSSNIAGGFIDLLPNVKNYYPSKNVNVRLKTYIDINGTDVDTDQSVTFIDGEELKDFADSQNPQLPYTDAAETLAVLNAYLTNKEITPVEGYYYAVSHTGDAGLDVLIQGWNRATTVAIGEITNLDTAVVAPTQILKSIQIVYLEITGESQAIILNAATAEEFANELLINIKEFLEEKELSQYYEFDTQIIDESNDVFVRPTLSPNTTQVLLSGTIALNNTALTGTNTAFTTELFPGANIYIGENRYKIATITSDTAATLEASNDTIAAGTNVYLDRSEATGFYSYDTTIQLNIKSKNGTLPPVFPGTDRGGTLDPNVSYTSALDEELSYLDAKYFAGNKVKGQDFVFAIRKAFSADERREPGFILAPEAYATLIYEEGGVVSKREALEERLKVSSAIALAAEGYGDYSGFEAPTQHVGLIDCGGDLENLSETREELIELRNTIGSKYGHLSYFAPYQKNSVGNFVPLSPYVSGIACSRFISEGFQQPPAGSRYPLRDTTGLKFSINSQQQETTYALGLNPAREMPNRGIVIWGSRTMSGNANFKYINTRVILNVLIDVLNRSFDDLLFEQIESAQNLFDRVSAIANSICYQFYRQGALFGGSPEEAYSIICSFNNNTYSLIEAGTVVCDVYVATSPTLERVLISVARTPAGQVSLINESLSRNTERFANLATTATIL